MHPLSQELKASISNISAADGTGGTTINQDDNSSKN
jgi:RecB family endonuclease NucS